MKPEIPKKDIFCVTLDNGHEVVSGLNIMVEILNHPLSKFAAMMVIAEISAGIDRPVSEVTEKLESALTYIEELNNMTKNADFIASGIEKRNDDKKDNS